MRLGKVVGGLVVCAMLVLAAPRAGAVAILSYMVDTNDNFGTIDLSTGAFTIIANQGVLLGGLADLGGTLYGTSTSVGTSTLYTIDTTTGALTAVGSTGIAADIFGGTLNGLFALNTNAGNQALYSIDPGTGAATLIGSTGLTLVGTRGMSSGSSTLFVDDNQSLYTLNLSTGASTLVGSGSEQIGALLALGGTLYGGANTPCCNVDTIDTGTGVVTIGPALTGTSFKFEGLAVPVPEPATFGLLGVGLGVLGWLRRRGHSR